MKYLSKIGILASVAMLGMCGPAWADADSDGRASKSVRGQIARACGTLPLVRIRSTDVAQTTSSTSLIDLTGASINVIQGVSPRGCVILNASFEILSTNAGSVRAQAFLDGSISSHAGLVVLTEGPMSIGTSSDFNFIFPDVSPGAHVVKLQVLSGSGQSITFRKWNMVLTHR